MSWKGMPKQTIWRSMIVAQRSQGTDLASHMPNHAYDNALDVEAVRFLHGDGLHRLICRMQFDHACFTVKRVR